MLFVQFLVALIGRIGPSVLPVNDKMQDKPTHIILELE